MRLALGTLRAANAAADAAILACSRLEQGSGREPTRELA
jgi:hypothetical protein